MDYARYKQEYNNMSLTNTENLFKRTCLEQDCVHKRLAECIAKCDIDEVNEWIDEHNDLIEERKYLEERLIKWGGKPKSYHEYLK